MSDSSRKITGHISLTPSEWTALLKTLERGDSETGGHWSTWIAALRKQVKSTDNGRDDSGIASPPPPVVGKTTAPRTSGAVPIPQDYAQRIAENKICWAPEDDKEYVVPKIQPFAEPGNFVRIHAYEIEDEFILFLMEQKAIPTFRFNSTGEPERGIVEPVPELPQEEFDKFIMGLANVEALFTFVGKDKYALGMEGAQLFNWSIGKKDPVWDMQYKKVTDAHLPNIVAAYCNLWAGRVKQFGCKLPIRNAVSEGLRPRPNYHVK